MHAWLADVIGTTAGVLTTAAFVPQVARTWRTRSAADFSPVMLGAFLTGVTLWVVYGVVVVAVPIILFNGLTLVLAGSILAMKLRFERAGART